MAFVTYTVYETGSDGSVLLNDFMLAYMHIYYYCNSCHVYLTLQCINMPCYGRTSVDHHQHHNELSSLILLSELVQMCCHRAAELAPSVPVTGKLNEAMLRHFQLYKIFPLKRRCDRRQPLLSVACPIIEQRRLPLAEHT